MPVPGEWIKVLEPGELPDGAVRGVECAGRSLCLVRHEGQAAALDNVCPHQGAPLSTGWLYEGKLVCAWHGWAFDPTTGEMPGMGARVPTFKVEEREDGLYVRLPVVP